MFRSNRRSMRGAGRSRRSLGRSRRNTRRNTRSRTRRNTRRRSRKMRGGSNEDCNADINTHRESAKALIQNFIDSFTYAEQNEPNRACKNAYKSLITKMTNFENTINTIECPILENIRPKIEIFAKEFADIMTSKVSSLGNCQTP